MSSDRIPEFGECPICGNRTIPVLRLLPCGHDAEPVIQALQTEGVIYAWTRSWTTPDTNTLLAMVDFMNGTLRAAAPVMGVDQVEIGDHVIARIGADTPLAFSPAGRSDP